MELWKDIPNYENLYQASNLGRIRSLDHVRKNGTNSYIQKCSYNRSLPRKIKKNLWTFF